MDKIDESNITDDKSLTDVIIEKINEIIDWAVLEHNCTISTKLHESS